MNGMKKVLFASIAFLAASAVFAQAKAPLTVIASEGPAQVILSGKLIGIANPRIVVQIAPGKYELIVRKGGLPEFRQSIVLPASGLTVNAQLGGAAPLPPPVVVKPTFTLTVTSNAPNSQVTVNGTVIGSAPANASVEAGNYKVDVTAPGYQGYSTTVSVNGNATVAANLQPTSFRLTVNANVTGAEISLNGIKAGNSPLSVDLSPGSYNLKVSAPGYQDYLAPISMNGPQNVSVNLTPMTASATVKVPAAILNRDAKNPESLVELYVDGVKQNALTVTVNAGTHRFRIVSGGLSVEAQAVLEAGKAYTIEPSFALGIR
ncbi:MAG TPA: hypothetical protein DIC34_12435 [Treponema sp.]|nr:MAG: hypothetical protein A2001_08360 [Treponema sp. GWC1_61_84]OHE73285.1 MAG: hypothetical protein A2413_16175 [Treponema sp. RIFOXYC1_FULL_61_9]HCM27331.1 hypothetical protein [Treponema sp.]